MSPMTSVSSSSKHRPSSILVDLEYYLVYPGQPLILANMIILTYPTCHQATNGSETSPPALCSQLIPGAGDAVSSTLRILEEGVANQLSSETMIEWLTSAFAQNVQSQDSFRSVLEIGQQKSERFHTLFRNVWPTWLEQSTETI